MAKKMTFNDYWFQILYDSISDAFLDEDGLTAIGNKIESTGKLRSAFIREYRNKDGIYIYVIKEKENDKIEVILTSSSQIQKIKEYIERFKLLSTAIQGSCIAYVDENNSPKSIFFRIGNYNDKQAIEGKTILRKNQSEDSSKVIDNFIDIKVNEDDSVGLLIKKCLTKYEALRNISYFLSAVLSNSAATDPSIFDDIEKLYTKHKPDIIQVCTAPKTRSSSRRLV